MTKFTCLLLLTFLLGLTTVTAQTQVEKPATGSISGRITVKQQPLPGITVTLEAPAQESSTQPRKSFSTKTDGDGRYRFNGVPKGPHVVSPRSRIWGKSTRRLPR